MKRNLLLGLTLLSTFAFAQHKGLIMEDYGKVQKVENPDLVFEKNKEYKVIFDVYTDSPDLDKTNPLLMTVARYLQIHSKNGIEPENLKVAVVMHGVATKNVLTDQAYKKQFKHENPNAQLIKILRDADVELFVCGQSFAGRGYENIDKLPEVKTALSALTALVWYQTGGYQVINFN